MTEEIIQRSNDASQGTLDILEFNGLEIIWDNSPLLVSWDGDGQYLHHYSLIQSMDHSLLERFKTFEKLLSAKKLSDSSEEIEALLSYFVNGAYKIQKHISPQKEEGSYNRLADYSIELPQHQTVKSNEPEVKDAFKQHFLEQNRKDNSSQTLLNYTTDSFPTLQDPIIGFKRSSELEKETIEHYETQINKGNYPYCLLFSCFSENEDGINCYCIGTIEILVAYQNLGIAPRYIELKKVITAPSEINAQVLSKLKDALFEWQMDSIFNRYFGDPTQIDNILQLTAHPLQSFIKQGEVTEYWPNGTLKKTGHHVNNKPNGIVTNYYANGQIESSYFYDSSGTRIRPVKLFFETGELRAEFIYNEGDEYGIDKLYRKDGSIQRVMYFLDGVCYIMKNGKYYIRDGKSEIHYHPNGQEEYVCYFKDGKKTNWQKFNSDGKLIDEMNTSAPTES